MGAKNCGQPCCEKGNEPELEKEEFEILENINDIKWVKSITFIQSNYRRHLSRVLYDKELNEFKRSRTLKMEKEEKKIEYKNKMDSFFKFKQEYEISPIGLEKLNLDIKNFYSWFFKEPSESNLYFPNAKTMNSSNEIVSKDEEMINVFTITMMENITCEKDFLNMFKLYFFSYLSNIFDIGNFGSGIEYTNFKIEKIKKDEDKDKDKDKDKDNITNNNKINFFPLVKEKKKQFDNKDVTKEKLLQMSEPFYLTIIDEIENYEKNNCVNNSFVSNDSTKYYKGFTKENTFCKWGIGNDYYISKEEKINKQNLKYRYYGYFKDGYYQGIGMMMKENGECYYGEFREGKKNGFGFLYSKKLTYKGFFYNDKFEGYGEYKKQNQNYYGNFKNGVFDGFGYLKTDVSTFCVGNFNKGNVEGEACYKWKEGEMYYGSWKKGMMHGYGKFKWKNGDKYIGWYENNLKNGNGKYVFSNGAELNGVWKDGNKEGEFTLIIPNDEKSKKRLKKTEYKITYCNDQQVV